MLLQSDKEEVSMHALLVSVTIDPGHGADAQSRLESDVLPRVKESPGMVSGVWTRSSDGQHGSSIIVFETEEGAKAALAAAEQMPQSEFIHFDTPEVREVVAQV
ncbi:MAG: hypothetical protein ABI869_05050 [Actinomycetota bacterium]